MGGLFSRHIAWFLNTPKVNLCISVQNTPGTSHRWPTDNSGEYRGMFKKFIQQTPVEKNKLVNLTLLNAGQVM